MKRLILITLWVLVIVMTTLVVKDTEVHGTAVLGNPDPMAQACATNYFRLQPHYCFATVQESWSVTVAGCNTRTLTTVPTSALSVFLIEDFQHNSTNVVGLNQLVTAFYNDGTCAAPILTMRSSIREFVATVAGTIIASNMTGSMTRVFTGGKVVTNTTFTKQGAGANVTFYIIGYYD